MIRYVPGTIPGLEGIQQIAIIDGDTHIGKWVEESGRLDHDQSALPRIGALIKPGDVVYDVGAFIGDHTAYYASKAARVVAIEPQLDAYSCLQKNCEGLANVDLFCFVVSDWNEPVECSSDMNDYKADGNLGARFVSAPKGCSYRFASTIDSLVKEDRPEFPPSIVKLDIEGWEVRALRGARETIARHYPIIVCEVNAGALLRAGTSPAELHALLTSYGYRMRDMFTEEPWLAGDDRPQFDVVCFHK